jgi:eukaryotic-like serine/threonine-protein kinase
LGQATPVDAVRKSLPPPSSERIEPNRREPEPFASEGPPSAAAWDEREAVRAAANFELHSDLTKTAVSRLAGTSLVAALVLGLTLVAVSILVQRDRSAEITLLGVAIGVSLGMHGLTRIKALKPSVVTELGFGYLFVLSLLLGLLHHSEPWPASEIVRQVSPVVIPILAFGALIPASPKKALIVLLIAATMDPLAMLMALPGGKRPELRELAFLMVSPYVAALLAQRISLVVYRLSEGIVKAREVGSYHLVEQLGVGGMAEVWRANHRMLARPAAVKLIRPKVLIEHGPVDSERLLRLFAREARTTAALTSPHTIEVYDFGVTREGAFYYVMELLNGLDLKTLVERFGPQPAERVAALLSQACHSLQEAHAQNFVHRDVKPANIFTCYLGGDYDFVKVLDFGLVLDRHPTAEELEDEKRFVGTPAVMAPEMVRFQAPVDARADIYQLGCVGYWLLTGKRVFEAGTRHDLLVMHAHQKPVPPSKRIEAPIHEGLEAAVMACLEKNPNKRPQTARELSERLAALSFDHPWTPERAALWWRKNRPEAEKPAPPSLPPRSIQKEE